MKKWRFPVILVLVMVMITFFVVPVQEAEAYIARARSTSSGGNIIWYAASSNTTSGTNNTSSPQSSNQSSPGTPSNASFFSGNSFTSRSSTGSQPRTFFSTGTRISSPPARTQPQPEPTPRPEPVPQPEPSPPASSPEPESPAVPSGSFSAAEGELFNRVNAEREQRGLSPLQAHDGLTELARLKSADMIENNYFAHESPTYGRAGQMIRDAGISYRLAAENLGRGGSIRIIFNAFMNSGGHRSKIIDSRYTHTGIGVVRAPNGTYYVTQMFIVSP